MGWPLQKPTFVPDIFFFSLIVYGARRLDGTATGSGRPLRTANCKRLELSNCAKAARSQEPNSADRVVWLLIEPLKADHFSLSPVPVFRPSLPPIKVIGFYRDPVSPRATRPSDDSRMPPSSQKTPLWNWWLSLTSARVTSSEVFAPARLQTHLAIMNLAALLVKNWLL